MTFFPLVSLVVIESAPKLPLICAKFFMVHLLWSCLGHTARRDVEDVNSQDAGFIGVEPSYKVFGGGTRSLRGGRSPKPRRGAKQVSSAVPQGENVFASTVTPDGTNGESMGQDRTHRPTVLKLRLSALCTGVIAS